MTQYSVDLPPAFPFTEGVHFAVAPDTGCWEWTGARTGLGHGTHGPHRTAYTAAHGEIAEGFHVHHACENPPCVNPAHLEAISHSAHSIHHGRAKSALTEEDIIEMRTAVWNGERIWKVAERYGITATTCGLICQGKKWRTAGGPVGAPQKPCAFCGALLLPTASRNPRRRKYCNDNCRRAGAGKS